MSNERRPEPLPLAREIDEPSPYPIDVFGPILKAAADDLVEGTQAAPAIVGQSLLSAASLVTQAFADVEVDGRGIPLSIFAITIADSGDRKTTVDRIVLSEIRKHESRWHRDYRAKMRVWQASQSRQVVRKGKETQQGTEESLCSLEPEPTPGIILVEEPTLEGIFKLLAKGVHFLGLFTDEGGRLTGGYAMNAENRGKTLSGLSELWDAKPLTRTRSGDGFDRIEGKRVSVHLMMQPVVAKGLINDKLAIGQGFMARTLLVMPASKVGTRFYRRFNANESPAVLDFQRRMNEFLSTGLPLSDEPEPVLHPRKLSLSHEAFDLFKDYYNAIETESGPLGRYFDLKATACKSAEQAIRIAGVLELFENPRSECISPQSMGAGITLSRYYLEEQLRIHEGMKIPPEIDKAIRMLKFIQHRKFDVIKLQDMYQNGPRDIRSAREATAIAHILEEHGWLYTAGKKRWAVVEPTGIHKTLSG